MAADEIASVESVWRSLRQEAEAVTARDPVFAATVARSILDHAGLGSAIAHQIGQRLGAGEADRARFTRVANEAYAASPDLVEAAARDLQGIVARDPAPTALLPVLLNFKGFVALQAWRVANWLWRRDRTDLALLLQSASSEQLAISIHPSASVGTSVFLDHATGIVVGALVSIGDDVTIYQNVTIGRKPDDPSRAPRIGRGVFISSGVTILGDVSIGEDAKIGAGSVVTDDVPAGCTAVGVPARLTNCPEPVPA